MAKPGVPVQFECEHLRSIMQNTGIKFSDAEDKRLDQCFKFRICRFIMAFVPSLSCATVWETDPNECVPVVVTAGEEKVDCTPLIVQVLEDRPLILRL